MRFMFGFVLLACLNFATPTLACGPEVHVQFAEESPDRFRITFVRGPKFRLVALQINLNGDHAQRIASIVNAPRIGKVIPAPFAPHAGKDRRVRTDRIDKIRC